VDDVKIEVEEANGLNSGGLGKRTGC